MNSITTKSHILDYICEFRLDETYESDLYMKYTAVRCWTVMIYQLKKKNLILSKKFIDISNPLNIPVILLFFSSQRFKLEQDKRV